MNQITTSLRMPHDAFVNHVMRHIVETLSQAWCQSVLASGIGDHDYRQDWSFDLMTPASFAEFADRARLWITRISDIHPTFGEKITGLAEQMATVSEKDLNTIATFYKKTISTILCQADLNSTGKSIPSVGTAVTNHEALFFLPAGRVNNFAQAATELLRTIRASGRLPTIDEHCCIAAAEHMLETGMPLALPAIAWDAPGFRRHQTLMSVTDPGPGHLYGTCLKSQNLDGVIVHIEHLERGVNIPRGEIEPYRIPAPRIVPRVCLRTASMAPVSTYVGRPMFDGDLHPSMLKTVHTFAAACSGFFADGMTECKVAIDGMTASQAIYFLKAVAANVRRDRGRQIISAAVCINVPIVDDRGDGEARTMTERLDIGMLGIEIAQSAGIEKVTWDGTADTYPSQCIIEQLGFENALSLVHAAHERGLLTYFSAGFRFHHIADAVFTGVDGIGIGGAQILRYMDYTNGNHGPFKEGNIKEILKLRDDAEENLFGRATKRLAQYDTLFHQGNLTKAQNEARQNLFTALHARDASRVIEQMSKMQDFMAMKDEGWRKEEAKITRDITALSSALTSSISGPHVNALTEKHVS